VTSAPASSTVLVAQERAEPAPARERPLLTLPARPARDASDTVLVRPEPAADIDEPPPSERPVARAPQSAVRRRARTKRVKKPSAAKTSRAKSKAKPKA
jgi:hypothetical protein